MVPSYVLVGAYTPYKCACLVVYSGADPLKRERKPKQGLRTVAYIAISICPIIHGHRTSKAPHPVRSAKLTGVPPS